MAKCIRCENKTEGDEYYCEPCSEHRRQLYREEHGIFCVHCGRTMLPGEFEQHKWRVFYRLREVPQGRRVRL